MATTEEGTHVLPDGEKLYTKTWKPAGTPRAILALVHGYSDHCNAYNDLFPTWASYGIEIRAFDQRGWGRSVTKPKERGLTGATPVVLSDIHSFLLSLDSLVTETAPLFLMGHSMGGGEVLYYLLNPDSPLHTDSKRPRITGVMAYAPLVALHPSTRPSWLTLMAGRAAGKLLPGFQIRSPPDAKYLSHDPSVCAHWINDDLCHDTGTLEGITGMLDRGVWLEELSSPDGKSTLEWLKSKDLPAIWFGHGTGDQINSWDATKQLATTLENEKDVTFCSYEGAYHRLHNDEPGVNERFPKDVVEWILAKCPADTSSSSKQASKD